ncbi:Ni/Co efflux regulator RcnB [Pseudomonas brassicacearum]|uniref:Ni/Co efflux regulator RcnB n=1 Tax=Pseudomonas brassicacearum TaxID=930166 RepID=A0AAW8MAC6_9PSED|nr:hypothetical protein [Pseudomonas brassicacearum]MDR6958062.1 Ni/Co efflux regulator RcnB [Pseudomonas brassicacearum]
MKKLTLVLATTWIVATSMPALASDGSDALKRWQEAFDNEQHKEKQDARQDDTSKRHDLTTQQTEEPSHR